MHYNYIINIQNTLPYRPIISVRAVIKIEKQPAAVGFCHCFKLS